ncbi:MAG: extensin family protein [bacterium]
MPRGLWSLLLLPLTVSLALADTPVPALLPQTRPATSTPLGQPDFPLVRPRSRPPGLLANTPQPKTETALTQPAQSQPAQSQPAQSQPATMKGAVCKDPRIKGVALKPIVSRTKGCNVAAPVLVSSIDGVRLAPAVTVRCEEAAALAVWIEQGLQPAFKNQVVQLNIADSYSCRPRNNVRGAKVSEHGAGGAVDISGFVLRNGKTMTVARNYGSQIRAAQKAGCGPFHTTLGPGSDGYHESHIHLDVAPNRGHPYCH